MKSLLASLGSWLEKGRKIDAHICDELNLHVGLLALDESRKSIEASQQTITQGYSVRRLTVIACIYLPLGLMTSPFGMNLKEFGSDGTTLGVFFIVASAPRQPSLCYVGECGSRGRHGRISRGD